MARARNIKPGFFESEQVGSVSIGARLLFISLWQLADREGRLIERPMQIRAFAFRFDPVTTDQVIAWLNELEAQKLIERFPFEGQTAIEIPAFAKHQRPHSKEPESVIARNISGEPEKVRATPPFHEQKPELFRAAPPFHEQKPELFRASASWNGGEPALNPECGMLNAECGMGNAGGRAAGPISPPPAPLEPDPQQTLRTLAQELCESLPTGGDLHLTAKQLETELAQSANHDLATFCASVRGKLDLWARAYRENRHLRPKAAQWWLRDGEYARKPPPTTATEAKSGTTERERLLSLFDEVRNAS